MPVSKQVQSLVLQRFPGERGIEVTGILARLHLPGLEQHPRARDRVHLGIVKYAGTDLARLHEAACLAEADWRDLLVAAGLENEDWPEVLRRAGLPVS